MQLCESGKVVCLAEQNNGYILQNLLKVRHRRGRDHVPGSRVFSVNTLAAVGRPQFIHSGTYEELIEAFGLTAPHIAAAVMGAIESRGAR